MFQLFCNSHRVLGISYSELQMFELQTSTNVVFQLLWRAVTKAVVTVVTSWRGREGRKVISLHVFLLGIVSFALRRLNMSTWKSVMHENRARAPVLGNTLLMWRSSSLVCMLRAWSLSKFEVEPPWIAHCCLGINLLSCLFWCKRDEYVYQQR